MLTGRGYIDIVLLLLGRGGIWTGNGQIKIYGTWIRGRQLTEYVQPWMACLTLQFRRKHTEQVENKYQFLDNFVN